MYCTACGKPIEGQAAFCIYCGEPTAAALPAQVAPSDQVLQDTATAPEFVPAPDSLSGDAQEGASIASEIVPAPDVLSGDAQQVASAAVPEIAPAPESQPLPDSGMGTQAGPPVGPPPKKPSRLPLAIGIIVVVVLLAAGIAAVLMLFKASAVAADAPFIDGPSYGAIVRSGNDTYRFVEVDDVLSLYRIPNDDIGASEAVIQFEEGHMANGLALYQDRLYFLERTETGQDAPATLTLRWVSTASEETGEVALKLNGQALSAKEDWFRQLFDIPDDYQSFAPSYPTTSFMYVDEALAHVQCMFIEGGSFSTAKIVLTIDLDDGTLEVFDPEQDFATADEKKPIGIIGDQYYYYESYYVGGSDYVISIASQAIADGQVGGASETLVQIKGLSPYNCSFEQNGLLVLQAGGIKEDTAWDSILVTLAVDLNSGEITTIASKDYEPLAEFYPYDSPIYDGKYVYFFNGDDLTMADLDNGESRVLADASEYFVVGSESNTSYLIERTGDWLYYNLSSNGQLHRFRINVADPRAEPEEIMF